MKTLIFVVLCLIWSLLAFGISRIVGLLERIAENTEKGGAE